MEQDVKFGFLYMCRFLPSMLVDPNCHRVRLDSKITRRGPEGVITTHNYSNDQDMVGNVTWQVSVERFHNIEFIVDDFHVDVNSPGDVCSLEVLNSLTNSTVVYIPCGDKTNFPVRNISVSNTAMVILRTARRIQGRGVYLRYRQVLLHGCRILSGETPQRISSPWFPHVHNMTRASQCLSVLIYLDDTYDNINITVLSLWSGCVRLSEIRNETTVNLVQTICNTTTTAIIQGQVLLDFDVTAVYSLMTNKESYKRSVDSVALDDAGRLQIISEGQLGSMCGNVTQPVADVICKTLGYGWPATTDETLLTPETLPRLVSGIHCSGREPHISECSFEFSPESNELCRSKQFHTQAVKCAPASISCDFTSSTCGYTLRAGSLFSREVGLYISADNSEATIVSPMFRFSAMTSIHFTYSIRHAVGDSLSLSVMDIASNITSPLWGWGNTHAYGIFTGNVATNITTPLWGWSNTPAYGIFTGCASLADVYKLNGMDDWYRIVIQLSRGLAEWHDTSAIYTGIRTLTLMSDSCADTAHDLSCTFEDLDACNVFMKISNLFCPDYHIESMTSSITSVRSLNVTSQITYGRALPKQPHWITTDHTYGNKTGHYAVIEEGSTLPLVDQIPEGAPYFRLFYGIWAGGQLGKPVKVTLSSNGSSWVYQSGTVTWTGICVDVSNATGEELTLSFGDVQASDRGGRWTKEAVLAIDDISFSNEPCSNYISCDFEDTCSDRFYSNTANSIEWQHMSSKDAKDVYVPNIDATFKRTNTGHYLLANRTRTREGQYIVTRIEMVEATPEDGCLNFNVYLGGANTPGSIQVRQITSAGLQQTNDIGVPYANEWLHTHVTIISANVRYVEFVTSSTLKPGSIAIDDVMMTSEKYSGGLQGLTRCTFDEPLECAFSTNFTQGSRFHWQRYTKYDIDQLVPPFVYDADGELNGAFMHVNMAEGSEGHGTSLWFHVNTSANAYQFSYIITGHNVDEVELMTYYDVTNMASDVMNKKLLPTDVRNHWILSHCFELPNNFLGNIFVIARSKQRGSGYLAVDNVQLTERAACEDQSVSCDFTTNRHCGYISIGRKWSRDSRGWTISGAGTLQAPLLLSQSTTTYCLRFNYTVLNEQMLVSGHASTLSIHNGAQHLWYTRGWFGDGGKVKQGHVTIATRRLDIRFVSSGKGLFSLWSTTLVEGSCSDTNGCDGDEFQCREKCIPIYRLCDRTIDCETGDDETNCGYAFNTVFADAASLSGTGYRTAANSHGEWNLESGTRRLVNGTLHTFTQKMLIAKFDSLSLDPYVLESPQYHVTRANTCLEVLFMGDAAYFIAALMYQEPERNTLHRVTVIPSASLRPYRIRVGPGNVRIVISVYMMNITPTYTRDLPHSAVFGLSRIVIHHGQSCATITTICPSDIPNRCQDNTGCYSDHQKCDLTTDCPDGSDEIQFCDYGIACTFENRNMCGYRNITVSKTYWDDVTVFSTPQSLWQRTGTNLITRPTFDHTYMFSGKGHYMTSRNSEGILDELRYVDTETMQSPYQVFPNDGCITFWYMLNSTQHQPKTTSAQLLIYLQYKAEQDKQLLWFDHVNRPFPDWVQGGVPVRANVSVSVIIQARTTIPYDGWTGVVAVDDIDFQVGQCSIEHPGCDTSMFRCVRDHVCIPVEFVCDGAPDCSDQSDERKCARPNGTVRLMSGDGSYGKLAYFYNHAWRPVCYPKDSFPRSQFNLHVARHVCRSLGYRGNSDARSYRLWDKYSLYSVKMSCSSSKNCTSTVTMDRCDTYAYVKCSNDVCFSGERLCPGTKSTCRPRSHFCDGETDCPDNTDEQYCYCFEGENKCQHLPEDCVQNKCDTCADKDMFECMNHRCISRDNRCDGVNQCEDGIDEYNCVQIEQNGTVSAFHVQSFSRKTICVDNVALEVGQALCRLSGQGYVREIDRMAYTIRDGVKIYKSANGSFLQNYHLTILQRCYPLKLICSMPECGSTSYQDEVIRPYIMHGREALIEEWPWYGSLYDVDRGAFICGASLISPGWAITATHCIRPGARYSVLFGTNTRNKTADWAQFIHVTNITDPGFIRRSGFLFHDLSLLKLRYPAMINNYTRSVCLPTVTSLRHVMERGKSAECYAVGWGLSERYFHNPNSHGAIKDVLQKTRVQLVPYSYCQQTWITGGASRDNFPDKVVCAGTEGPSSPTCFGDSGGPLVCRNARGRWQQIGAVSFGYGNCYNDLIPSVFTSLADYRDWIETVTGISL